MCTTPRSCKQRRSPPHTAYGVASGEAKAKSTPPVRLYGRCIAFHHSSPKLQLTSVNQINDCWPVTSWAIVDYFLRPKPAYFTIARELRPYTVGMTRKTIKTPLSPKSALYSSIETHIELWGTNSTLKPTKATLEIRSFDVENGGKLVDAQKFDVMLAPNSSTELWKGNLPGEGKRTRDSDPHNVIVVQARLLGADGKVLARYSNW